VEKRKRTKPDTKPNHKDTDRDNSSKESEEEEQQRNKKAKINQLILFHVANETSFEATLTEIGLRLDLADHSNSLQNIRRIFSTPYDPNTMQRVSTYVRTYIDNIPLRTAHKPIDASLPECLRGFVGAVEQALEHDGAMQSDSDCKILTMLNYSRVAFFWDQLKSALQQGERQLVRIVEERRQRSRDDAAGGNTQYQPQRNRIAYLKDYTEELLGIVPGKGAGSGANKVMARRWSKFMTSGSCALALVQVFGYGILALVLPSQYVSCVSLSPPPYAIIH